MEIDRVKLLESVARILPATARKEVFEQATKIVFTDGCVAAYNDEISIFDRRPELDGIEGAVDGRHLHDLLAKMSASIVDLSVSDSKLNLRAGRVKASFDMAAVALPFDEIDREGSSQQVIPDNFVVGLRLISGTCARDESQPVLTCISFSGNRMEAADGFRAARLSIDGVTFPNLLLPVQAAEVLVDYGIQSLSVSDSGAWVRFTANQEATTIFARTETGKFPDLSGFYEVDGVEIVLPSSLMKVLERARIFTKREHSIDEVVGLSLRPNQITVSAGYDGGQFTEVVRSDQDVTANFSIHPEFLSEVLKTGTSCTVGGNRIKFSSPVWEHVIALRD